MLWQTHIRIANEVLQRLGIPKSSREAERLREGVLTPDKWGDYPHHYGKSNAVVAYVLKARKLFLFGDLPNAYFCLGVALHYIQDSYTSLSSRSPNHQFWEQQIEESYFVEDLEKTINWIFRDRQHLIHKYLELLKILSREVEGKNDTLYIATLLGHEPPSVWGKPSVDLNLALRASLHLVKSVLGSKRCPRLEKDLSQAYSEYEDLLKKTEIVFVDKLVELIKKREDLKKKKESSSIISKIRNVFLGVAIGIRDLQIHSKFRGYTEQRHLEKVIKKYEKAASRLSAPHVDWYDFNVRNMDIKVVEKDLLSIQEATGYFGIDENTVRKLVREGKVSCYSIKEKELVRRLELQNVGTKIKESLGDVP